MQDYPSFGACLKELLHCRDLSILEASRIFGMKSSTSLMRIIHDEVNIKTLERFWEQIQNHPVISLSCAEKRKLRQALSIQRIGLEQHLSYNAMWNLLLSPDHASQPEDIPLSIYNDQHSPSISTFSQLLHFFSTCRDVQFIISGCCFSNFLNLLHPLCAQKGHSPRVHITHCLHSSEAHPHMLIRSICAIRPFLSLPNYTAYITDQKQMKGEMIAPYEGNEFLCTITDWENKARRFHGVLIEEKKLMLIEYVQDAPYRFQADQFWHHHSFLSPIKTRAAASTRPEEYIEYIRNFLRLESNRTIYTIKPDLPLYFIHPDLLLSGLLQNQKKEIASHFQPNESAMQEMYQIHLRRWKNIFEKKKVTHAIFDVRAMENFVRTGVQCDHFFAMPPFSCEARRTILTYLRTQMQENPYFNIHFSSDNTLHFQLEIAGYENESILLSDSSASYDFSCGYSEAFINQPEFCQSFSDFYINELLASHVHSPRESLAIMDQLIASIP